MKHFVPIFLMLLSPFLQAQIIPIVDIQFSTNGPSPLDGMKITTEGVVVASGEENNLDAVFIQQEGETAWAGIQLKGSIGLVGLRIGDKVVVEGTVREAAGMTTLDFITAITLVDSGISISPIKIDPAIFTTYSVSENEKYECMYVQLELPPDSIFVVNQNADGPDVNFGDYRLGSDLNDTNTGCRVLAGIQSSNTFSSLNVSYVNSDHWESNSGMMNVPVILIENGDAFAAVRGIIVYGFGEMRLLPRNNDDFNPGEIISGIQEQWQKLPSVLIYPNPAKTDFRVDFESSVQGPVQINIFDLSGRQFSSSSVHMKIGENWFLQSIDDLPGGSYIAELQGNEFSVKRKFIKIPD